jgi:hypothetical protein
MHTLVALPPKSILPMLQQHGAHLLAWLLSLSRTPEPSRGAAAGPAGRAVETPYAAAAALSDAPGIGRANPSCGIPRGIATRCDRRHQAKRPRRMGLCSEVADGGENLEDHPALASRYVRRKAPVSACKLAGEFISDALNLFHSLQTKPCLGHCITRGLGLRRQATILRLRGAVLFSGSVSGSRRGNSDAPAGLKRL